MSRVALHKSLAWIETAWREPMLLWLAVSAAAHAGVVAILMTPDPAREQVIEAGGAVAVEVVLIEGPELHAGAQSGEDRAQKSAAATVATDGNPSPEPISDFEAAPSPSVPPQPMEATPLEVQDTPADEPEEHPQHADAPAEPAAPRLIAAPQTGQEAVAAAPTLPETPSVHTNPTQDAMIRPAPTPRRKPPPPKSDMKSQATPAQTTKVVTQDAGPNGQDAERPAAQVDLSAATPSAGGTRGAAPRGDNPKPVYPFGARRRGEQGRVLLRVTVSPTGAASTVSVAESSGSERLDNSALETVRQWRFQPAHRAGTPVAAEVTVPIRFQLR